MGRLQHLPGIERMEVGVVVLEPLGRFQDHALQRGRRSGSRGCGKGGQGGEAFLEASERFLERGQGLGVEGERA